MTDGIRLDNIDEINKTLQSRINELEDENYELKQLNTKLINDYAELVNEFKKVKDMISFI